MPASPFIQKGCSLVLNDYTKVNLTSKDGAPILSGQEIGGLYYLRCKTIHDATPSTSSISAQNVTPTPYNTTAGTYFGLPFGKTTASGMDFSRRLLESHWAYGHLHMDKLRKLFGLPRDDNPDCAACSEATSRKSPLEVIPNKSTHVNRRMHMDLGYTRDCNTCFQLYVEDYTGESWLDVLKSKSDNLTAWIVLKTHLENEHAP
jgi:hypothetical protein